MSEELRQVTTPDGSRAMLHKELLTAARSVLQAGHRQAARVLLTELVRADPTQGEAWHLLAQVMDDPRQQAECAARARTLLMQAMATASTAEQALLELGKYALPAAEAIDLLEAFLRQHPQHPFAPALQTRLEDLRIIAMLHEGQQEARNYGQTGIPALRLGEYLIERGWVTREQVAQALAEQERLREAGTEYRLGTLLMRQGHLQSGQLALALAALIRPGSGELGAYLVQRRILAPEQLGLALARQARITIDLERAYEEAQAAHAQQPASKPRFALLGKRTQPPQVMPHRKPAPKLGEVLVSMGALTPEQVATLLRERDRIFNASREQGSRQ